MGEKSAPTRMEAQIVKALTIVDTDILIDATLQINKAIDCLDGLEQNSMLAISVITQMELFVGCRDKTELGNTKRFLQRFQVLKLSDQISDKAIGLLLQYRLSHGLAIPDALIAGIVWCAELVVSKVRPLFSGKMRARAPGER